MVVVIVVVHVVVVVCSVESVGGAVERHEARRWSSPGNSCAHSSRHAASADVRARNPEPTHQPLSDSRGSPGRSGGPCCSPSCTEFCCTFDHRNSPNVVRGTTHAGFSGGIYCIRFSSCSCSWNCGEQAISTGPVCTSLLTWYVTALAVTVCYLSMS